VTTVYAYFAGSVGEKPRHRRRSVALGPLLASVVLLVASAFASNGQEALAATASRHPTSTSAPTTSRTSTSGASSSRTSTSRARTTTTRPASEARGPQTVLSPVGLNVRSGPSKSDKVVGTAAQGVALLRLGRTNKNGGWYEVSGATVIGWISAAPSLSAPGHFGYYGSTAFNVLYPAGWTFSGKPNTGVGFRPPSTGEDVIITASTSVAKLPTTKLPTTGHATSISRYGLQQVVACGVSGYLYTYRTGSPHKFYADAAFSLGPGHALGLRATLTSLSQITTLLDFVNSISFPLPVCVGKAATKH
jgi:Bacterial SH3 domain